VNDIARSELAKKIAVLGAGIEIGASQRGTLMGPAALRTAGLLTLLESLGFAVEDRGDLSVTGVPELDDVAPDNCKHYREIQRWIRTLSARAYELAHSGVIPIFIGGDHSLSMGSVNGVARHCRETGRDLFVMWLDAHADVSIFDPESKLFYVGNGGRQAKEDYTLISVVDTASDKKTGDIKIDGEEYLILREDEVLGILEPVAAKKK